MKVPYVISCNRNQTSIIIFRFEQSPYVCQTCNMHINEKKRKEK